MPSSDVGGQRCRVGGVSKAIPQHLRRTHLRLKAVRPPLLAAKAALPREPVVRVASAASAVPAVVALVAADTAVAAGGTSIEAPPGLRESNMGNAWLAYVRDPDGNKLCAIYRPV